MSEFQNIDSYLEKNLDRSIVELSKLVAQPSISAQFLVTVSVVTTAIAIPTMPNKLPRRAVSGELRPFSARIKKTDAIRYASATEFADIY